mgnify:CR=1 FL=1|jgi:prepilin peptidase CpaA
MGGTSIITALHAVLALLLVYAAIGDIRTRTIPNWLNLAIALMAPLLWHYSGLAPWPGMAIQFGIALICFVLFTGAFALNMMGGGDVKLIAALALWLPAGKLVPFLLVMSIIGGLITLGMWAREKIRKSGTVLEVPYGVAIALAGLWIIHERYLNHFG